MAKRKNIISTEEALFRELSLLIEQSQQQLVKQVNSTLTILFWHIGKRIKESILNNKRADYGKQVLITLSRQLSWSHILVLFPLKNVEAKLFYAKYVSAHGLGVRELRKIIAAKEFERTSIANLQNSSNNPGICNNFKDPFFLDFLGLRNTYQPGRELKEKNSPCSRYWQKANMANQKHKAIRNKSQYNRE